MGRETDNKRFLLMVNWEASPDTTHQKKFHFFHFPLHNEQTAHCCFHQTKTIWKRAVNIGHLQNFFFFGTPLKKRKKESLHGKREAGVQNVFQFRHARNRNTNPRGRDETVRSAVSGRDWENGRTNPSGFFFGRHSTIRRETKKKSTYRKCSLREGGATTEKKRWMEKSPKNTTANINMPPQLPQSLGRNRSSSNGGRCHPLFLFSCRCFFLLFAAVAQWRHGAVARWRSAPQMGVVQGG